MDKPLDEMIGTMQLWPQLHAGAEIQLTRLVHDDAKVVFPPLTDCAVECRSHDRSMGMLLFGPAGDKGVDLRPSPRVFQVNFNQTGMLLIPVDLANRATFSIYYKRNGVPFRTMFTAEISGVSGGYSGDHDDAEDRNDITASIEFKVTWLCGRAPAGDDPSDFVRLVKESTLLELKQIAERLEASASDLTDLAKKIKDRL